MASGPVMSLAVDVLTMGGEQVHLELDRESTVYDLKLKIVHVGLVEPKDQKLCLGSRVLMDSDKLKLCRESGAESLEVTLVTSTKLYTGGENLLAEVRRAGYNLESRDNADREAGVKAFAKLVGRFSSEVKPSPLQTLAWSLVMSHLNNSFPMTRRAAVQALGKIAPINDTNACLAVTACLEDPSDWVRVSASEVLLEITTRGNRVAIDKVKRLLKSRRAEVRLVATMAMGGIVEKDDNNTISTTIEDMVDDQDEHVRLAAFDALRSVL